MVEECEEEIKQWQEEGRENLETGRRVRGRNKRSLVELRRAPSLVLVMRVEK